MKADLILPPQPDIWNFVETRCAVCHQPECRCKADPARVERCACGVHIRAEYGWERRAVMAHVASDDHQAWRRANGL